MQALGVNLNWFYLRSFDFFVLNTKEGLITILFSNFGIICSSSVRFLNRTDEDLVGSSLQ